mmetsp:Transcript_11865/g.27477  ORF Transcript_11865/g.27477 Transcript_11865/m.27477 type:complete len:130 (+) Transcript_11865:884-1273(+)
MVRRRTKKNSPTRTQSFSASSVTNNPSRMLASTITVVDTTCKGLFHHARASTSEEGRLVSRNHIHSFSLKIRLRIRPSLQSHAGVVLDETPTSPKIGTCHFLFNLQRAYLGGRRTPLFGVLSSIIELLS